MLDILERRYLPIAVLLSLAVLALNFHATAMQGIVPYYADFARIIAAGFDPAAGVLGAPTFPMWGYGWLIFLLRSRLVILLFQQLLAAAAYVSVAHLLRRRPELGVGTARTFKILIVFSLPLFAVHSVYWPYSISASLLALSLVSLLRPSSPSTKWVIVSGILFGLMLNFRSDFILFPPVAALLFWNQGRDRKRAVLSVVWLLSIYLMLVPWGLYTRRASGQFHFTSSNSGQVLFAGLGQLPGKLAFLRRQRFAPPRNRFADCRFAR
jgi:hypothetical protein